MSTAGNKTVTVTYTEDDVSKTAEYTISVVQNSKPVDPEDEPETPANKSTCGGSIIATSGLLSSFALLGAGLIIIKKKKR